MTPLREALDRVLSAVAPVAPQPVPLPDALGKALAATVAAAQALPAQPLAARRGIAVASRDLVGASPYSPVLVPSRPALVMPGDKLPPPADAVIAEEALVSTGALHELGQGAYPGEGAVLPGADLAQGATIARAGATATPSVLLALALGGVGTVAIRSPVVAVSDPQGLAPAVATWLRTVLAEAGCRLATAGESDLRIVIARDPSAAFALGRPVLRGLALNPGRDTAIALDDGGPSFALPPRFDAVAAVVHALIVPALARMTGRSLRRVEKPLTERLVSQVGLSDIVLLRSTPAGYTPLACGQIPLQALIDADAVAILGPDSEGMPAGGLLAARPLRNPYEVP